MNIVTSQQKSITSKASEIVKKTSRLHTVQSNFAASSETLSIYGIIVDYTTLSNPETISSIQTKFTEIDTYFQNSSHMKVTVKTKIVKPASFDEALLKGKLTDCKTSNFTNPTQWMLKIKQSTYDKDPDRALYKAIVFIFPFSDKCESFSTQDSSFSTNSSLIYINGQQKLLAYTHEIGHYANLGHANYLTCGSKTHPDSTSSCVIMYQEDPFSSMGKYFPGQVNGLMKSQKGWLDSKIESFSRTWIQKLKKNTVEKEFTISAIETLNSNTQIIKIPKSDVLFGDSYYVEFRMPILFDDQTPLPAGGGVLIYMNSLESGATTDTLLMPIKPLAKTNQGTGMGSKAYLIKGDFFEDIINKIKVTVLDIDSIAKTVKVKIKLY